MAIFASIFAFLGRQLGRILSMAIGWASVLLFGRVPQSKQLLLSAISFGSIAWLVLALGVLLPDVGAFLLAAVPVPDFIDENIVRLVMLVAFLALPLVIGVGGLLMLDPEERPKGRAMVVQVLRGYPYALVLAVSLMFMAIVAPVRKLRTIVKRWSDAHIPVVVKPGGYERVAHDLESALDAAGLAISRRRAPRVLEAPAKLLGAVAGGGVGELVPDQLIVLGNEALEVLVYPSDISVAGRSAELARARAAVASRLTFTAAYLTSSDEGQQIEDRLERLSRSETVDDPAVRDDLDAIDRDLASLEIPYEQWEVLYRLRLHVERNLLAEERARQEPENAAARSPAGDDLADRAASAAVGAPLGVAASLLDKLLFRTPLARLTGAGRRPTRP